MNIFLDSLYTERLMGFYNENVESYRNASLIENADGLRHKNYMLIHGLYDDNVQFQHSAMLSKELQHKAIVFRQQVRFDIFSLFERNISKIPKALFIKIAVLSRRIS